MMDADAGGPCAVKKSDFQLCRVPQDPRAVFDVTLLDLCNSEALCFLFDIGVLFTRFSQKKSTCGSPRLGRSWPAC